MWLTWAEVTAKMNAERSLRVERAVCFIRQANEPPFLSRASVCQIGLHRWVLGQAFVLWPRGHYSLSCSRLRRKTCREFLLYIISYLTSTSRTQSLVALNAMRPSKSLSLSSISVASWASSRLLCSPALPLALFHDSCNRISHSNASLLRVLL